LLPDSCPLTCPSGDAQRLTRIACLLAFACSFLSAAEWRPIDPADSVTGASISNLRPSDSFLQGRFRLEAELETPAYAQIRANRLMIFKPALLGRRQQVFLTEPKRSYPVLLNSSAFKETVHVQLPQGFKVDEVPDPAHLEMPFGSYVSSCTVKDGELVYERTLEIRAATIPVADYASVRQFFERILTAEQSPAVLVRQ
jgi:hypothetical protein